MDAKFTNPVITITITVDMSELSAIVSDLTPDVDDELDTVTENFLAALQSAKQMLTGYGPREKSAAF
jgi:hypothetical protein